MNGEAGHPTTGALPVSLLLIQDPCMITPNPPIKQILPMPTTTPRVGSSPAVRVVQQYGADIMKLGALDVKPTGANEVTVRFDTNMREHVVGGILADSINGVAILTTSDMQARCIPRPVDAAGAARLISRAGITGVAGADVRSTAQGNPTMHVQVATERTAFVKNLLEPVIGGAPVVINEIALPAQ